MSLHPCDLCGETRTIEVPHCREYTGGQPIDICARCGFVYVRERRSAREIAETWSKELYGSGYTARWPAVKARHAYVAEFADASIGLAGKALCDIGAGEGQFLALVRATPYEARVFGIEPSEANGRLLAGLAIEHFTGTIEEYVATRQGGDPCFDVVTILWTLENCQSLRAMLATAHDILAGGRHVVVATGSRILVPYKKPLHYYLGKNPADTHAFRFSANTLRGALAVSGFETVEMNRFIDSDYLCAIGRWADRSKEIPWPGDDPEGVADFFARWHEDTRRFYVHT
ncbi:MAG: methyltransferase domain-containing protein [Planctomycetes bacterium]|nr:methyltransferase domain-containing protein [Planctomycetota bacterium]